MGNIWDIKARYKAAMNNEIRGNRGIFGVGETPSQAFALDYVEISTTGNAADFGDLSTAARGYYPGMAGSNTRCFTVNLNAADGDGMHYNTFSSLGNSFDFGNLTTTNRDSVATCGNNWRFITCGGYVANPAPAQSSNVIDYVNTASLGDATDFGDLSATRGTMGATANEIRGVVMGGAQTVNDTPTAKNIIEYVTFTTTGNMTDFGDLVGGADEAKTAAAASATRGFMASGHASPGFISQIDKITFATTGNSIDWGDLTVARRHVGGFSSNVRGLAGGGNTAPALSNVIDYYDITSASNATDFGDLVTARNGLRGASNAHGGLGADSSFFQRPSVNYMP